MKHEVSIIMYSRNMRYDSGFEKRKKKQRLEAAAQSQKSAHDRFVLKEYQINSENQTAEGEARVAEIGQGDYANIGEEVSGKELF
jgi:hypothetical protein